VAGRREASGLQYLRPCRQRKGEGQGGQAAFAGGGTIEDASAYFDAVDARNFDLLMQTRSRATIEIPPYYSL
jgi:hypothetical protein